MRVILCLVAFIAAVNGGIIGDSISDSALLSIIQQIGLVEGHSVGHHHTIRIIQEHHDEGVAKEVVAAVAHEAEANVGVETEDNAAEAPGPGYAENDYIIKAVLAARHAAVAKKR